MPTKFFTNQEGNSLLKKFEGVFTHIQSIRYFDALVGYFRASGYFKVRPFLDKIQKIRILVGINVDKLTEEFHAKGQLYLKNPDRTKEEFVNEILQNCGSNINLSGYNCNMIMSGYGKDDLDNERTKESRSGSKDSITRDNCHGSSRVTWYQ